MLQVHDLPVYRNDYLIARSDNLEMSGLGAALTLSYIVV